MTRPCGPAVRKLCEHAREVYGESDYAALAAISISHLDNLRKSTAYACQRRHILTRMDTSVGSQWKVLRRVGGGVSPIYVTKYTTQLQSDGELHPQRLK